LEKPQHLVKPLSLDLATEEGIQEKAARNYGYLALMNQTAQEHNYTFDILISRPSAKASILLMRRHYES
jgi:hypothetical protein